MASDVRNGEGGREAAFTKRTMELEAPGGFEPPNTGFADADTFTHCSMVDPRNALWTLSGAPRERQTGRSMCKGGVTEATAARITTSPS